MLLFLTIPLSLIVGLVLAHALIGYTKRMQIEALQSYRRNRAWVRNQKRRREFMERAREWRERHGMGV